MEKETIIALVKARVDVPGLVADVVDQVLEPALDKFVADSANPYDDMLKAAIYPVLEKELKAKIAELWAGL